MQRKRTRVTVSATLMLRFDSGWQIGCRSRNLSLGGLFAMAPIWAAGAIGMGFLIIGLSRYVSVGSMIGAIFTLVAMLVLAITGHQPWEYFAYTATVVSFILLQHKDNIVSLVKRQERRLGDNAERRGAVGAASDTG